MELIVDEEISPTWQAYPLGGNPTAGVEQSVITPQPIMTLQPTLTESDEVTQPSPTTPIGVQPSSSDVDTSGEPLKYRSLTEIYNETQPIELAYEDAFLAEMEEPTSFKEAKDNPAWVEAMDREIESIEKNRTWSFAPLPAGCKAIGLKWVFKLKKNSEGEVIKHKARLVAKGYVQQHGVDFEVVFAPVARLDTVRLILAIAANRGWLVHHLDVKHLELEHLS